ncbi:MAG TPA: hypothetical protein VNK70_03055 [Candidatus Paceibacterota bacterium]|nr:hypothetical protein [Candidatus Paceibacterota bacterium]
MKGKVVIEIILSIAAVLVPTFLIYGELAGFDGFWDAQNLWSVALITLWTIVALGYYHQGWLVHKKQKADEVSIVLPLAVFFVQCVLFVKGIYYGDWSLAGGALIVNSGVFFSLYNILKVRRKR